MFQITNILSDEINSSMFCAQILLPFLISLFLMQKVGSTKIKNKIKLFESMDPLTRGVALVLVADTN